MISYYNTISAQGRVEIEEFLNRYHKQPGDQNISAWVEAAECNMNNNSSDCATIEIPSFDAKSGHVETLTLERDSLTRNEIEE